jgi:chromosome segregation ATPase
VETTIAVITGVIIGGIILWFLMKIRSREDCARQISELQIGHANQLSQFEAKARSAEAVVNELRQLIQQKDADMNQIRTALDSERQVKTEAITKLEAAQKGFEEQKALIDTMKQEMPTPLMRFHRLRSRAAAKTF